MTRRAFVVVGDHFGVTEGGTGRSMCVYALLTEFWRWSVTRRPRRAKRSRMHWWQKRTAGEHFWRRGVMPTVDTTHTTDSSASREHRLQAFSMVRLSFTDLAL